MNNLLSYGKRTINYIYKYPRHFAGYLFFGSTFFYFAHKNKTRENEIIRIGFAGAIAQFSTEILFHPIDVINTRVKAEIAHSETNSYRMIRRILQKEGFLGFWRGASSTFYGALLGGFIYFSSYKYLKNYLKKFDSSDDKNKIHSLIYLVSSLLGETLFLLFYYPYDLIRTRTQTRLPGFDYKGPIDGAKKILEGKVRNILKLYTGATPSFVLNLANQSIMFTVLESMREYYLKKNKLKSVNDLKLSTYLFCSLTAGAVAGGATNILEVITIHKQVDPNFKFFKFLKEQGIKSLTKGLIARMTINMFHSVTLFFVVDYMSNLFNVEL
jgi:hypothetical protein